MARKKNKKKRFIVVRDKPSLPNEWTVQLADPKPISQPAWKPDIFLGLISLGIGFPVAVIASRINSSGWLSHGLFLLCWLLTLPAIWMVVRAKNRSRLELLGLASLWAIVLAVTDISTVRRPRSRMHLLHANLDVAKVGFPVQAHMVFKNDGDAAVVSASVKRGIYVSNYFAGDAEKQIEAEDFMFSVTENAVAFPAQPTATTLYPESERDVAFRTTFVLDTEAASALSSGRAAVYVVGTLFYDDDRVKRRSSEFCGFWQKDTSVGPSLTVCSVHNKEE